MKVSAKADYAVRAVVELAVQEGRGPVKGERIAQAQDIPWKFCENILAELRAAGVVASRRGAEGGYWLARPASDITLADVIRIVDGPLAAVQGVRPTEAEFAESAIGDATLTGMALGAGQVDISVADCGGTGEGEKR